MQLTRHEIEQVQNIMPTTGWKVFMKFMEESITKKFMSILENEIDHEYTKIQYSEMQVDQRAYKFFKERLKEFEKQAKLVEVEKMREKAIEGKA